MITFSLKKILSVLCAGAALTLVGCGGSGSEDAGLAPDNIGSYVLQAVPGESEFGVSPGLLNIYGSSGVDGSGVNTGNMFNAQVSYVKTSKDTASLSVGWHTPENTGTPTTKSWEVGYEITFTERQGTTIIGTITKWNYGFRRAGHTDFGDFGWGNTQYMSEGYGSTGTVKLVPR